MKKIFSFITMASLWSPIYADAITDGISNAGDAAYSYTPYVQAIAFVLACVMGIVGAFVIYYAIVNNAPDVKKRILTWGGSCVTMLCMAIALPGFFNYQEGLGSGALADAGTIPGFGNYTGGDNYGRIITEIPDPDDPRWRPDPNFGRHILPYRPRNLGD